MTIRSFDYDDEDRRSEKGAETMEGDPIQFYWNIDDVPAQKGDRIFQVSFITYSHRFRRWCVANNEGEVRRAAEDQFDDSHIEGIDEESWS